VANASGTCISDPPEEIHVAARYLDEAVTAHMQNNRALAADLIRAADMPAIHAWLKPIWSNSEQHLVVPAASIKPTLSKESRPPARMPSAAQKREIHQRDGYNCRFCGMPVIRPEVRRRISIAYAEAARWGTTEAQQHAGFQAMWAQYDHIVPHAHGGTSEIDNMVLTCAACNFGRGSYLIEELGITDPRLRSPLRSAWDGLERFQ